MSFEGEGELTTLLDKSNAPESAPKIGKRTCLWVCIATSFVLLFAVSTLVFFRFANTPVSHVKSLKHLIDASYHPVLPNYELDIQTLSMEKISGTFSVDGLTYQFTSKYDSKTPYTVFKTTEPTSSEYYGFKTTSIVHKNELILEFFKSTTADEQVILHKEEKVDDETRIKMEKYFSSKVNQHFVQLSYKLASYKLIGKDIQPLMAIYKFAESILKMGSKNENIKRTHWVDLGNDYLSVSSLYENEEDGTSIRAYKGRGGGKRGGGGGGTQTSAPEMLPTQNTGCSLSNQCGNACFGMCGLECDCWAWACGDCQCWPGCLEHDYWCSCDYWSYWYCCLNMAGFSCFDWQC